MFGVWKPEVGFDASYYAIKDIKKMKERFMRTLIPLIEQANANILKEKNEVIEIMGTTLVSKKQQARLTALAKKYRIKKNNPTLKDFLLKIDIVPPPLVLAQAAAESSWGRSRFAKEANNLFGEWTWGKRGIIPKGRPKGKKYKIRIYRTLQDSVEGYMLNLNRHYAYEALRQARYEKRSHGKCFLAKEATEHLHSYSQIGDDYKNMLKGIIHYNRMCEFSVLPKR